MTCAYWYEPRAAFYTHKAGKKQNINVCVDDSVRKNFHSIEQQNERHLKKNWQWDEDVT